MFAGFSSKVIPYFLNIAEMNFFFELVFSKFFLFELVFSFFKDFERLKIRKEVPQADNFFFYF